MLNLGDLLQTLNDPSTLREIRSQFGYAVAADGNLTVVGTPYADIGGYSDAGRAYVFNSTTGALVATLNNPTPADGDNFGSSVAMSGSTLVVGAPRDNTAANRAGSAYIFDAATGNLLRTLNNPTPADDEDFGGSVAVSGSTVLVGAPHDDTGADWAGSAYIYDAVTGSLLRTLNNPTPANYDTFGSSVAVSGSTVVVGTQAENDAGSAYIFDAATGNLVWTLNPTPSSYYFGSSVALSGTTVLVGAPREAVGPVGQAGAAYIFDAATGNLLRKLTNPTPRSDQGFGSSLAASGSTVVVGMQELYYGQTIGPGAAYIYDAATGNLLWTLNNPTPAAKDYFGWSVAVSGTTLVVGAP